MDNLDELKKIWLSADTAVVPDAAEMLQAIRKYRNGNLWKKVVLVVAAALLTGILVMVVFLYRSAMVSTRIGEACMILAGLLLLYGNMRSVGRLYKVKDHSNKEFITYLEQVQRNRAYYHNRTQVIGMLLVCAGLLLYVYEMVSTHLLWAIVAYAFILVYMGVIWLVVRPRAYARQQNKLQETIKKMTELAKQF